MKIKNNNYSYYDCKNKCNLNFGEKDCHNCDYYISYMTEKEINDYERKQSEALNRQLSRIEDGDFL